jgi:signal peptidase I
VRFDDHILVRLNAYSNRGPERGAIIVYRFPMDPEREFLHRVVGLPGERIRILERTVHIDGEPLDEPYAVFSEPKDAPRQEHEARRYAFPEQRIPDGHYFILGDNRDNAHDSRFWGYLPSELIRGGALYVYWSPNLSRVGATLRGR